VERKCCRGEKLQGEDDEVGREEVGGQRWVGYEGGRFRGYLKGWDIGKTA